MQTIPGRNIVNSLMNRSEQPIVTYWHKDVGQTLYEKLTVRQRENRLVWSKNSCGGCQNCLKISRAKGILDGRIDSIISEMSCLWL